MTDQKGSFVSVRSNSYILIENVSWFCYLFEAVRDSYKTLCSYFLHLMQGFYLTFKDCVCVCVCVCVCIH